MVEHDLAKVETRVRFPSPAPTHMFPFTIFSTMKRAIREKVDYQEPGLYLQIVFPIAVAFLLTFGGARLISQVAPYLYLNWEGLHVHHFTYGFFILAAAGYLSLVFSGPRAKYLIALLHGFGLGLAFDEFAMWLHLSDEDPARWSYDGFLIIIGSLFVIITARPGVRMLKNHLPFFGRPKMPKIIENLEEKTETLGA